jgi:chaperonin GroEL
MKTNIHDTQEKLRKGLNKAADVIVSSMGGKGRTVIIKQADQLTITKDGVSIAKSIKLPDPVEDIGAQLLISAANETVKACGDGTTLTSLLLREMVNATKTKQDYDKLANEVEDLKDFILSQSKELTTTEEIYNIAKTSSNDPYVAVLIQDIYNQTAFDTHIELETTEENETTTSIDKGLKINTGFDHNWQINDPLNQQVKFDDPTFYLTMDPLHHASERIKNIVRAAIEEDAPLVFIADKYSREFINFIQQQVIHSRAKILTLRLSEFFGEDKYHQYMNIKTYLTKQSTADSIVSNPYYTIISNNEHNGIEERLEELKSLSSTAIDPLDAKNYKKLYHQLSGTIATIWVGGRTKEEIKELYDRIEDAVGAVRTAIDQGYVLGMGKIMLWFASHGCHYPLIWKQPFETILVNAQLVEFELNDKASLIETGYDLDTGKAINLLEAGIIDPTLTLLTALDNALANTKLVLNTKYILHNELQESDTQKIFR